MDSNLSGNSALESMNSQDPTPRANGGHKSEDQHADLPESPSAESAVGATSNDNGAGTSSQEEISEPSAAEIKDGEVQSTEETDTQEVQKLDDAIAPQEDLPKGPVRRKVNFYRSAVGCEEEANFWCGQNPEPYAAPEDGWTTIQGTHFHASRARSRVRALKVAKAAMKLSLARIEEYNLEDLPDGETYLKTLLKDHATEAEIRGMEVRQAFFQRHIAILEMGIDREPVIGDMRIPDLSYLLRCYFAHQIGVPFREHSETTVFRIIATLYRPALPVIDQILDALEEALSDKTRWSDQIPAIDIPSKIADECSQFSDDQLSDYSYCSSSSEKSTLEDGEQWAEPENGDLYKANQEPKKPSIWMRLRGFFGLRTSKLADVEAGDHDWPRDGPRHGWIRKAYEGLYCRSKWVRAYSDDLNQILNDIRVANTCWLADATTL